MEQGKRIAVVTGSNKGIGLAIVKGLCEKFDGIVYLTARDITRGEHAVKELQKSGLQTKFHQLDIADDKSVETFANYLRREHGGIDILVNNAGIAFKVDSKEPFAVQAKETVEVNYFGTLRVSNALFPLLRAHARVVNISSCCGHLSRIPAGEKRSRISDPEITEETLSALMNNFVKSAESKTNEQDGWGSSAYNVSKNGVSVLSFIQQKRLLADDRKDIVINAVHPGYVATDMSSHKGDWTVEQGADAALYLALLPEGETNVKGCYVWKDRAIVEWAAADTPTRY